MRSHLVPLLLTFAAGLAHGQAPRRYSARDALQDRLVVVEQQVVPAAEAMPATLYGYTPAGAAFAGVRSFADQLKHLAAANWQLGSKVLGEQPPAGTHDETAPSSVRSKGEIIAYLRGSFDCLHRAIAKLSDANLMTPLPGLEGTWERTRLGLIVDAIAHASDHYGQIVEYLRANNIVPPASRSATEAPGRSSGVILSVLGPQEERIIALAEAMPADKYDFVPSGGQFTGVRSFSAQLKHIAADLYLDGKAMLGDSLRGNVVGEEGDSTIHTKAEIIQYVQNAFAYMHRAALTIDDANSPVKTPGLPYGPPAESRLRLAITDIAHTNDHYGQLVEYLRMNGIVPPESRK